MNETNPTPKVLESRTRIRFQHCDPFNHLNNAEYLNYLVNAREDHLLHYYGIDIYEMGRTLGKSWVVGTNQIAYLRPAFTMEEVVIESQLLGYDDTSLRVEMRMYDKDKQVVKAVMWSTYVHFNLLKQARDSHSPELMELFSGAIMPVEEKSFEERAIRWKDSNNRV